VLREQALSGLAWRVGARVGQQTLQLAFTIALMRLLSPEDFGLIAMVSLFVGFASLFTELGLSAAVVQRSEVDDLLLSSAFWLNLAAGVVVALVVAGIAPLVAAFFDEPGLLAMTVALAITFPLSGASSVHRALLIRAMRFRELTLVEIAATAVAGPLALAAALFGAGAWSLVLQSIVVASATAAGSIAVSGWRPRLRFRRSAARDLLGFGGNLVAFRIVNYWIRRADNLLIGKWIGPEGLGIYGRAYNLMTYPVARITGTLGEVMFPALSRIQGDLAKVRDVYLRSLGAITTFTFPLMAGLFVVADEFTEAVLGPAWIAIVPVVRVLSLVGLVQSATTSVGWIFQSQGRPDLQFRLSLVGGLGAVASYVIGLRFGVLGVATGYALWSLLWEPVVAHSMGRLIGVSLADIGRAVAGPLFCAAGMAIAVAGLEEIFPGVWPAGARLLVEIAAGASIYVLLLHFFDLRPYRELRAIIAARLPVGGVAG
jgi:PST family polysaccharide transporter